MAKLIRISGAPKFKPEGDGIRVILKSDTKAFHFHMSLHDVMAGVRDAGLLLTELLAEEKGTVARMDRKRAH